LFSERGTPQRGARTVPVRSALAERGGQEKSAVCAADNPLRTGTVRGPMQRDAPTGLNRYSHPMREGCAPKSEVVFARVLSCLSASRSTAAFVSLVLGFRAMLGSLQAQTPANATSAKLPTLEEAVASRSDLWGEAALRQPDGPSYEFFEKLLPPPRYVNADFKYYPIVLSAPNAKVKARLISNGSGVNLRGGARSWNDVGTPVVFRVGPDELRFGEFLERLQQPTLAEGYLPIAEIRYAHDTQVYKLEAFAATDPTLAENAVVFVKFSLASGSNNFITVQLDAKSPAKFANGKLSDEHGEALVYFDKNWTWERQGAHAKIGTEKVATLAIPTKPLAAGQILLMSDGTSYDEQRKQCVETWQKILRGGMNVEVPEPYVNNAWRHLIIQ